MKNKKKILLPLLILGIVLVVIGGTYAFYNYAKHGEKMHTIRTGAIKFRYEESNRGITLNDALPMTDAQGKAQTNYFDFSIISESDFAEIPYVISTVTSSNSTLDPSVVKVYLTEVNNGTETQLVLDKYSNLTSKVFVGNKTEKVMHRDTATVTGQEYVKNYRLRIWISDDIEWLVQENGVDTYPYQNKTLTLKVNVYTNEGNSLTEANITTKDDTKVKMMSMNAQYLLIDSEENGVDYYVNVPNNVTTADLNIIPNNAAATVNVTELGQTLSYNEDGIIKRLSTGTTYNLLTGDNFFKVRVTSADTTKNKDYIIKVNREKQHDNNLNTLNVEGYSFTEEFNEEETEYTVNLEGDSIVIGGQTVSDVASITGDGEQQLEWGENRFTITVTAEDGTPKEYTIIVNNVRPTPPSIADEDGVNNTESAVTEEEWSSSDKTISIVSPGTAISEVDHYEYYVSSSNTTPSDNQVATGQTQDGTVVVSNSGTNYVYYRTVSGAGYKSEWSAPQEVKIDKTEYTISYTLNSGSLASGKTNPTTYKVDTETITLNNPSKTNYTFTGWTGSNGSTAQTTVTIPKGSTGNKTYTANYQGVTSTITLNNQSATSAGSTSVTGTYASAVPTITKPTKTGYTFGGYYTSPGGEGTQYIKADGTSARNWDKTTATTLYAKWTINFSTYLRGLSNSSTVIKQDETTDKNMRFIGSSPNNYVSLPLSDGTTELFRVIGVFNSNSHGRSGENLVKLVRAESLGNISWDTRQNAQFNKPYGYNVWSSSELKTTLNGNTYKYIGSNYIQEVTWKTGATSSDDTKTTSGASNLYTGERSNTVSTANDYITYTPTWTGKVALPYASDVLYSTNGYGETSRATCLSSAPNVSGNTMWNTNTTESSRGPCSRGSWLIEYASNNIANLWTLSAELYYYVYYVDYSNTRGVLMNYLASSTNGVLPTVYLKQSIICTNCNDSTAGTSSKPWTLSLN